MPQYRDGTVSVTNGLNVVTGVGTLFLANVAIGDLFIRDSDKVNYFVDAIASDLSLTLTANYGGINGSGLSYAIHKDFITIGGVAVPLMQDGDLETIVVYNRMVQALSSAISAAPLGVLAFLNTINNDNWLGVDLSIANGGTGASTAVDARTALDIVQKLADISNFSGIGRPEILVNPKFEIWQDGTSKLGNTAGTYLADQFLGIDATAGTFDLIQIAGLVNEFGQRLTAVSAASYIQAQRVKKSSIPENTAVSIVFKVLVSAGATNCKLRLYDGTSGVGTLIEQNFIPTGSLQTVVLQGNTATHVDARAYWTVDISCDIGIGEVTELHDTRMEIGPAETPRPFKSESQTILECEVYFQKSYDLNTAPGSIVTNGQVIYEGTGAINPVVFIPLSRMSSIPIFNSYSPITGASGFIRDSTALIDTPNTIFTPGDTGFSNYVSGSTPAANADLTFHYTADARFV